MELKLCRLRLEMCLDGLLIVLNGIETFFCLFCYVFLYSFNRTKWN